MGSNTAIQSSPVVVVSAARTPFGKFGGVLIEDPREGMVTEVRHRREDEIDQPADNVVI